MLAVAMHPKRSKIWGRDLRSPAALSTKSLGKLLTMCLRQLEKKLRKILMSIATRFLESNLKAKR
jgi:hypothetical protein